MTGGDVTIAGQDHRPPMRDNPTGGPLVQRKAVPELAGGAVLGHLRVASSGRVDERDAARNGAEQAAAVHEKLAQQRRETQIAVEVSGRRS